MMDYSELGSIISFVKKAEGLKNTLRSGYTSSGKKESVADHTWRLTLFAVMLYDQYFSHLDFQKLVKICLIHDLGEIVNGDIPAPDQSNKPSKSANEEIDFRAIINPLPEEMKDELMNLWKEYEEASSEEARLVKALDKLETLIQHNQGSNPPDFDYEFNITYGRHYTDMFEVTRLIRKITDEETRNRIRDTKKKDSSE